MTTRKPKSLRRIELRDAVYKVAPQLSREQSYKMVDEFFEEIIAALADNQNVSLRGFGLFKIQHKRPRPGRNPKTGEEAVITARRVVKFTPSPILNARVNGDELVTEDEE